MPDVVEEPGQHHHPKSPGAESQRPGQLPACEWYGDGLAGELRPQPRCAGDDPHAEHRQPQHRIDEEVRRRVEGIEDVSGVPATIPAEADGRGTQQEGQGQPDQDRGPARGAGTGGLKPPECGWCAEAHLDVILSSGHQAHLRGALERRKPWPANQ